MAAHAPSDNTSKKDISILFGFLIMRLIPSVMYGMEKFTTRSRIDVIVNGAIATSASLTST